MIFVIRRIDVTLVAELRACYLDELSAQISSKDAVRAYEKAHQKKEEIMARTSKQSSSSNSQKSKSTGSAKSQTKSCSNCGCTKE